jgi:hypothetical protein
MEKSSGFKDEIYKIVKYQTKLASSKNIKSSHIYRQKLSEHVEKMKMTGGGQNVLDAMNGGVDFDAILEKRRQIKETQGKNASDSEKEYQDATKALQDAEKARDEMLNIQGSRITDLLQSANKLNEEIEEATSKLAVSEKNLTGCTQETEKLGKFIDEQEAEILNLIQASKGPDAASTKIRTEELANQLRGQINRAVNDIKLRNKNVSVDAIKQKIDELTPSQIIEKSQIYGELNKITKDSTQNEIDIIAQNL